MEEDQESLKGMSQPIQFNEADLQDDKPKNMTDMLCSPTTRYIQNHLTYKKNTINSHNLSSISDLVTMVIIGHDKCG